MLNCIDYLWNQNLQRVYLIGIVQCKCSKTLRFLYLHMHSCVYKCFWLYYNKYFLGKAELQNTDV